MQASLQASLHCRTASLSASPFTTPRSNALHDKHTYQRECPPVTLPAADAGEGAGRGRARGRASAAKQSPASPADATEADGGEGEGGGKGGEAAAGGGTPGARGRGGKRAAGGGGRGAKAAPHEASVGPSEEELVAMFCKLRQVPPGGEVPASATVTTDTVGVGRVCKPPRGGLVPRSSSLCMRPPATFAPCHAPISSSCTYSRCDSCRSCFLDLARPSPLFLMLLVRRPQLLRVAEQLGMPDFGPSTLEGMVAFAREKVPGVGPSGALTLAQFRQLVTALYDPKPAAASNGEKQQDDKQQEQKQQQKQKRGGRRGQGQQQEPELGRQGDAEGEGEEKEGEKEGGEPDAGAGEGSGGAAAGPGEAEVAAGQAGPDGEEAGEG